MSLRGIGFVTTEPLEILFLMGCTGCGKGAVAREFARRVDAEILSVDSMKVYRRMDIGTAKPDPEIRREIPHHLIDVVEPHEDFSVAAFVPLAESAAAQIAGRGRTILAVGGTALYIKALSEGLFEGPSADPEIRARLTDRAETDGLETLYNELAAVDPAAARRIHRNEARRIVRALEVYEVTKQPISTLQTQWDQHSTRHRCTFIGLRREIDDQNHRTNMRVKRLIARGWVDEVRALLFEPRPLSRTARQALGYRELIEHVHGRVTLEDAVEKIKISTRQFGKAQRTWFKRFSNVQWFDLSPQDTADQVAEHMVKNWQEPCCK